MKEINSNFGHDPLNSLIERTLSRDAETERARFATIPNAQLTAKLALSTATRGLWPSLATKLALYAGAALLVGAAVYLIPTFSEPSTVGIKAKSSPVVQQPALPATESSKPESEVIKNSEVRHVHAKANIQSPVKTLAPPSATPAIKLDDGDAKSIPHYTDPKYEPPLK